MSLDKVKAKNFYQDAGDKTMLNWCLYEYSNILYTKIEESPKLANYRKSHCANEVEAFCVYFSKRLRKSVNDAQTGHTKGVTIDARYVYEFYPENTYQQTQRLLDAALSAWNEHVLICSNCPNQCLIHGYEITDMFDNLETVGWPTRRHNQQE